MLARCAETWIAGHDSDPERCSTTGLSVPSDTHPAARISHYPEIVVLLNHPQGGLSIKHDRLEHDKSCSPVSWTSAMVHMFLFQDHSSSLHLNIIRWDGNEWKSPWIQTCLNRWRILCSSKWMIKWKVWAKHVQLSTLPYNSDHSSHSFNVVASSRLIHDSRIIRDSQTRSSLTRLCTRWGKRKELHDQARIVSSTDNTLHKSRASCTSAILDPQAVCMS